MKLAIGMIMQETNSFCTLKADIDDFLFSPLVPLLQGRDLVEEHRGKRSEVGGFIEACEENGVEIVPTIATFAVTSGNVTQRAFRWLTDRLLGRLKQVEDLDGVLLALHGAMAVDGLDDPDGEILAQVRELVGDDTYLGCSLDLHANLTEKMVANADILIGYETHADYEIIGRRTAQAIIRCIRSTIRPQRSLVKIPAVYGAHSYVLERKRELEKREGVLSISLFDDNPWTDVQEYGPDVLVITEGRKELGEKLCQELASALWDVRHKAVGEMVPIAEAVETVKHSTKGSIVLVEAGDLVGGGGAGDSVAVLDALLESGITNTAALLYDPVAVAQAFQVKVGSEIEVDIGGKHPYEGAFPLRFKGRVKELYDGTYTLKGIPYEGITAFLGRTAVISAGDTEVVLTSKRIYPQGAAVFDALGMDLSAKRAITLKGFSSDRGCPASDFGAKQVIYVDTPGWTNWHFCSVPYKKIDRPIYPLDPVERWQRRDYTAKESER